MSELLIEIPLLVKGGAITETLALWPEGDGYYVLAVADAAYIVNGDHLKSAFLALLGKPKLSRGNEVKVDL